MRVRRSFERALLFVGFLALDVWIWSNAGSATYQVWENWVFNQEIHHQAPTVTRFLAENGHQLSERIKSWLGTATAPKSASINRVPSPPPAAPPPVVEDKALIGRLSIPRLHLSAIVREGAGEETLSLALGHIPHTALPGQPGNVGVAGHRDRLFRGLRNIRRDDVIVFETVSGKYTYQVKSTSIVRPQDTAVLHPGRNSELTLVTCYPFYYVGSAPKRFIVKALQLPPNGQVLSAKL
jgi:sortase A